MTNIISAVVVLFFLVDVAAQTDVNIEKKIRSLRGPPPDIFPSEGLVPTKEVALKIAEAVLEPLFKKETLLRQYPLQIEKKNGVWIIDGKKSPACPDQQTNCYKFDMSPLHMEIRVRDAQIIRIYSYK